MTRAIRYVLPLLAGLAAVLSGSLLPAARAADAPAFAQTAPEDWLNSKPLDWPALRGTVVLVEFWTFACSNCIRSQPWLRTLEAKFPKGFEIIGVHTPELPQEYVRSNVVERSRKLGITHPVVIDNDYATWNAWSNRYWPAFYLVDAKGQVRAQYIGETHAGDERARRIEADIARVLSEH